MCVEGVWRDSFQHVPVVFEEFNVSDILVLPSIPLWLQDCALGGSRQEAVILRGEMQRHTEQVEDAL